MTIDLSKHYWPAIELLHRFYRNVDSGRASLNVDLFTEDGAITVEDSDPAGAALSLTGRSELERVFRARERLTRASKHVLSSTSVRPSAADGLEVSSTLQVYDIFPPHPPELRELSDWVDQTVVSPHGVAFRRRSCTLLFRKSDESPEDWSGPA